MQFLDESLVRLITQTSANLPACTQTSSRKRARLHALEKA